jgi:ribosomal 50S subunit-associated protein YjgA (DUF615 family)
MNALTSRPAAGSDTSNQYGTFKVSYATQKQTNFIQALMDRKDLSAAEGLDVAKLAEQVAATQVNKTAASAIIDRLLALPDATSSSNAKGAPATTKQKDFVRVLLSEREDVEAIRQHLNKARENHNLTAELMSAVIEELLEIAPAKRATVPNGRYALPAEDGHYVFYKVDSPESGKWVGYTFVVQLLGSVGSWDEQRLSKAVSQSVQKRIAENVEEAARMFGIKASACGYCCSPLSNPQSRAAGYGETCAHNHGFNYPSLEEALDILAERGDHNIEMERRSDDR